MKKKIKKEKKENLFTVTENILRKKTFVKPPYFCMISIVAIYHQPSPKGNFRVHLSLHFKARLSAKSLLWKSLFIHIEIGTNYHNKNFALRLALKERLRGTRKWPIISNLSINGTSIIQDLLPGLPILFLS